MKRSIKSLIVCTGVILVLPLFTWGQKIPMPKEKRMATHHEIPDDAYLSPSTDQKISPASMVDASGFFTRQVNVDAQGNNIIGDAANEPSIAIDPTNPDRIAIGWRQFDNVSSNFRQAGYGFSTNGGLNWTFPGSLEAGLFRSDPVLDFDSTGAFYYNSLTSNTSGFFCKVFKSTDGGASWDAGAEAHGGDKQWMAVDRSGGEGEGNIYSFWSSSYSSCLPGFFTRSTDQGASFEDCVVVDGDPYWGTMEVGPTGELYIAGAGQYDGIQVSKSTNAQTPGSGILWDHTTHVDMDGFIYAGAPVNPQGIIGQAYIDIDRSNGPGRGNVYVTASIARNSSSDPADVMFSKSTDGGLTWSAPLRLNNDQSTSNYQWFGTMSVAPNGRIDVVWLDNRDAAGGMYHSALYYCHSEDQGESWSINKQISNYFDPRVGYPQQEKMGDYFDMVSDNEGAHLAWASTLNGEQDVYYSHIIPTITGIEDETGNTTITLSTYPNPFRDKTTIRYSVASACTVKLVICNIDGKEIKTLMDERKAAGTYQIVFNEEQLPAGFYFCRLTAGTNTQTTRLIKLK